MGGGKEYTSNKSNRAIDKMTSLRKFTTKAIKAMTGTSQTKKKVITKADANEHRVARARPVTEHVARPVTEEELMWQESNQANRDILGAMRGTPLTDDEYADVLRDIRAMSSHRNAYDDDETDSYEEDDYYMMMTRENGSSGAGGVLYPRLDDLPAYDDLPACPACPAYDDDDWKFVARGGIVDGIYPRLDDLPAYS